MLDIDSYLELDARLAWRPQDNIELSISGRNLLEQRHAEFVGELGDIPATEIERSVYGELRWSF